MMTVVVSRRMIVVMPVTVFMAATLMSMMMVVVPVTVVMRLPVRVYVPAEC
jgi:hypothetical protein